MSPKGDDSRNLVIYQNGRWMPMILRRNLFWVPKLWIWQPIWTMMPMKRRIQFNWGKLRSQNDSNIFKYILYYYILLYKFQNLQPDHLDIILQMLHHFRHWWLTISSEQREVPWEDCNRRPGTDTIDVCRSSANMSSMNLWIHIIHCIQYSTILDWCHISYIILFYFNFICFRYGSLWIHYGLNS